MRPIMIAMRKILGRLRPVIARIPNTERIHRISRMPPTSLNGLGKMLIAVPTSARIRRSTTLMTLPLMVNKEESGILIPSILR